jgi:hypothetical protein
MVHRLAGRLFSGRVRWLSLFILAVALVIWSDSRFLWSDGVGLYDWRKELHYYHYFVASLQEFGELPLSFIAVPVDIAWYPVMRQTASYWASPETVVFSPLVPFGPWLSAIAFMKASLAFHLVVATAGIFWLAARLGIGAAGGLVLSMLTAGNPWLMQHEAIGYTPWMAAAYVPLIAALLVGQPRRWHLAVASALGALLLYQGAVHVFFWLTEAMLALAVVKTLRGMDARPLRVALQVAAGAVILALPRLVAIGSTMGGLVRMPTSTYGSLGDLLGLLTDTTSPVFPANPSQHTHGTILFDASCFMGWWLLAIGVLLVLAHPLLGRAFPAAPTRRLDLVVVAVLFVALGWQGVWAGVVDVLPGASAQAYPYRFLAVAGFLLIPWIVCEAHAWLQGLLGPRGPWLLPLVFLPTLVAFHGRNETFVEAASSRPDTLRDFRLRDFYAKNVTVRGLPASAVGVTPRGVRIALEPGSAQTLFLPWIRTDRERDSFEFRGAMPGRLDLGRGLYVSAAPGAREIEVRAKDYGRVPLAALAAALAAVWWVCSPRDP